MTLNQTVLRLKYLLGGNLYDLIQLWLRGLQSDYKNIIDAF